MRSTVEGLSHPSSYRSSQGSEDSKIDDADVEDFSVERGNVDDLTGHDDYGFSVQSQVSDSDHPITAADLVQLPSFLHLLLFFSLHHLRILCLQIDLLCFLFPAL